MSDPRYPIGRFVFDGGATPERLQAWIGQIREAPAALRRAAEGLTEAQLDTPYRDGGWTVRQVVHHLADSHMNNYVRVRLALTEERPTVKAYDEQRWAELADARTGPVELSLRLLELVHARWVMLMESMAPADFGKSFMHPESGEVRLDRNLALYVWHGKHHTAHITGLRERMGW